MAWMESDGISALVSRFKKMMEMEKERWSSFVT